jgi:hypothetical protein
MEVYQMHSGLTLLGPLTYVISLVIWIAILVWVYNSAEENFNAGCLWFIIVFLFPFLGLVIYLIVYLTSQRPAPRHRAVNRNADFNIRAAYTDRNGSSSGQPPSGQWGHAGGSSRGIKPDPAFRDEDLDRMIAAGRLSEAREYLRDMKSLAREMNDTTTLNNYSQYDRKIANASRKSSSNGFSSRW